MLFSHPGEMTVKAVFASNFRSLRPVVDLLKFSERLVNYRLDVGAGPHEGPLLLPVSNFSEPIIFQCKANKPDIKPVIELEIQLFVCRFERPYAHRINERSEQHTLLLKPALNRLWLVFAVFIRFIKLA